MATTPAKLIIEIVAEANKAKKELEDVAGNLDDVGDKGGNMGKALAAGAAAGAAGLVALGVQAFNAAEESAKIGRETTRVIASTGAAAWISSQQVGDLATAISEKTGADDEAIQSSANLILSFTRVRNEVGKGNDVFNQATELALDMSTALGSDLSSASLQLGKALNDPVKGMTALSRAGVSFNEEQRTMIKSMVESGDLLSAQKVILAEVAKEFGGAAEAAGTPLDKLMVKVGNLQEDIGAKLIPVVQGAADVLGNAMGPALEKTSELMDENAEAVKFLGSVAFVGLTAAMAPALAAMAASAASPFVGFIKSAAAGVVFLGRTFTATATEAGVLSGAMATLNASLLPELAIVAALGAAVYGFASILDSSSDEAQKFWKAVHADVNTSSFTSLADASRKVNEELKRLEIQKAASGWRDYGAAIADVLIPFTDVENSLIDQADLHRTLADLKAEEDKRTQDSANALYLYAQNAVLAAHGIEAYGNATVGTTGDNAALSKEIFGVNDALKAIAASKKIDITDAESVARVTALYEATRHGTSGIQGMTEAQEKFNDAAATAKDKVDAYKQSLDALVGVHLSAEQAETNWIKSALSLHKQFEESNKVVSGAIEVTSGMTLQQTEAVVKNQTAVQSAAKAAMDMAVAKGQESGSYTEATRTLELQRKGLIDTMVQMGVNRDVAETYVNQLGLTPENLQTQMHIDKKKADEDLRRYFEEVAKADTTHTTKIEVDTSAALWALGNLKNTIKDVINSARKAPPPSIGGNSVGGFSFVPAPAFAPVAFAPAPGPPVASRAGAAGTGTTINVNVSHAGLAIDSPRLQREIVGALRRYEARNGRL